MSPETKIAVRQAAEELVQQLSAVERGLSIHADEERDYAAVKAAVEACVARLDGLKLPGPQNRIPSSELWNLASDLLLRGWLQTQARTKPRGYAGDHEMLARIYENRLSDDPLGRLFDRYFQEEAAPRAVRNRMGMMSAWIRDLTESCGGLPQGADAPRSPKIAIVGSAFGLEVRDALRQLDAVARGRVSVVLMDLDPAAIDFAREQLLRLIAPERLKAVSANLFRLPDRPALAAHLSDCNLLMCPGLFDYLDDPAAATMLQTFWERLAPGGRLAVFQFAPHNPTRTYMEWFGNWYLTYRTREQLAAIAAAAGIPSSAVELSSEPLGVDLLLSAVRHA